jgi:hypothetical protein
MKIIYSVVFAIVLAVACDAQTDYSQEQLVKIFNDHLPQYTNSVQLTKNLIFHLTSSRYGCYPATEFRSDELISSGLIQTPISVSNTNVVIFCRIPYNQTFDFHLFDENGREINKTKTGLDLSKPTNPVSYGRDVGGLVSQFIINNDDCRNLFRPDDMFVITNNGTYDLSISMRICVPTTNGVLDTNALTNFHAFSRASNFDVVASPALHVRVIKN